jgi:hypothetical protein
MLQSEGHTFIVKDEHIDDTAYNFLLEFALKTNNKLVWANNNDELWLAYLKYNKGKNFTYYVLNFY